MITHPWDRRSHVAAFSYVSEAMQCLGVMRVSILRLRSSSSFYFFLFGTSVFQHRCTAKQSAAEQMRFIWLLLTAAATSADATAAL